MPRHFQALLQTPEGERTVDCAEDEFIWNAAARGGITLPSICHQGQCLTCAARLIEGEVDQSAARAYFPADGKAGFVLPCTARPKSNLVLQTHQQWAMREFRKSAGLPAPYG